MNNVKFIHLRPTSYGSLETYANGDTPHNGGATVAYATDGTSLRIQIARCSPKDRYCKRIGRATAQAKGESVHILVLPASFDASPRAVYQLVLAIALTLLANTKKVR